MAIKDGYIIGSNSENEGEDDEIKDDNVMMSIRKLDDDELDVVDISNFDDISFLEKEYGDEKLLEEQESKNIIEEESMEDRIANAQKDRNLGRVHVSQEMESFSRSTNYSDYFLSEEEEEAEELIQRNIYELYTDATQCSACGATFQSKSELKPGFLPKEKYQLQMKLAEYEKLKKVRDKADLNSMEDLWSPEDEIEWMLSQSTMESGEMEEEHVWLEHTAQQLGFENAQQLSSTLLSSEKKVICQRCHKLQNTGQVSETLRPGWTTEPSLKQEHFRKILQPIKKGVVVVLVDVFDFHASVLPQLESLLLQEEEENLNPIMIVVNKIDLLPNKLGKRKLRIENWIRNELDHLGVTTLLHKHNKALRNNSRSVTSTSGMLRLVSCKTGFGVDGMLKKVRDLADEFDTDVYVVGAANAGKSTLMNHLLKKNNDNYCSNNVTKKKKKKSPGKVSQEKLHITTSPLPGTTLQFIKINIGNGRSLYDTPGLLIPGTVTSKLTPEELKMVVPRKQVQPVTFRVAPGKCVLIGGGLATIEILPPSKPFLFTFYISNEVKLHPTDSAKMNETIQKQVGKLLVPPLDPNRLNAIIGENNLDQTDLIIEGCGWKEASADVAIRGLGWIAITGAGKARVRVGVPHGIGVSVRPPMMPYDIWDNAAKYTGGKAVVKKRRGGIGGRSK